MTQPSPSSCCIDRPVKLNQPWLKFGSGEALLRAAVASEQARTGIRRVVLQSSDAGYSLYRRLGFSEVAKFETPDDYTLNVKLTQPLVDQFSALAQFPAPQPRPCDMNMVAEEALAFAK